MGSIRLDGKVAIVTGASKGIGRAITDVLLDAGATVVGVARRAAEPDVVQARSQHGERFHEIEADVSSWDDCATICDETLARHGRIDILVNNAATSLPHVRIAELTREDWTAVMGVSLEGVLFMSRHALPHMIEQRDGVIINIGSTAAVQTAPSMGSYAASKAAIDALARVIAVENVENGVRANTLLVGSTKTELSDRARLALAAPRNRGDQVVDGYVGDVVDDISTRVRLLPDGVAGAVLALCCDEAREITASTVMIDRANVAGLTHGKVASLVAARLATVAQRGPEASLR